MSVPRAVNSLITKIPYIILPTTNYSNLVAYTDGSCLSQGLINPRAGFGVFWGNDHPWNCYGTVPGLPNCHRAEIFGAVMATQLAIDHKQPKITIRTDSQVVMRALREMEIEKFPHSHDLFEEIEKFRNWIHIDVEYVKGHSGVPGNVQADRIAKKGANCGEGVCYCCKGRKIRIR
ncbi:unnamed protein product [Caenorhabditis nigoni]